MYINFNTLGDFMTTKRKIQNIAFHAGIDLKTEMQLVSELHDINWSRYFRACAKQKVDELMGVAKNHSGKQNTLKNKNK